MMSSCVASWPATQLKPSNSIARGASSLIALPRTCTTDGAAGSGLTRTTTCG